MSTEIQDEAIPNNWQPRKTNIKKFESGNACALQRPGPELALHTSQLQRQLRSLRKLSKGKDGKPLDEEKLFEQMSEEQRRVSLDVMRHTVAACVKKPRIYVNPKARQVGVDDIPPEEFLWIWNWYTSGCPDLDEEVTPEQADSFPAEQAAGVGAGDSGGDLRPKAERVGKTRKRRARR
jgi:hypothetical protein